MLKKAFSSLKGLKGMDNLPIEVIKNKEAFIKHLVSIDKKQVQPKLI